MGRPVDFFRVSSAQGAGNAEASTPPDYPANDGGGGFLRSFLLTRTRDDSFYPFHATRLSRALTIVYSPRALATLSL
jgi:hypothetical protein